MDGSGWREDEKKTDSNKVRRGERKDRRGERKERRERREKRQEGKGGEGRKSRELIQEREEIKKRGVGKREVDTKGVMGSVS